MKELYTKPEVKLISFVSEERIANDPEIGIDPASVQGADVTIDFTKIGL